ncbi:protocatechuate 3,4-dioxygenase subunit alpha [Amycolatopsis deserti]|nr:protocatechuate 3,4-dioxygenase subunit alpha [Amycolatopsis deserti]
MSQDTDPTTDPRYRVLTPSQGPGPYASMTLMYDGAENGVAPGTPGAVRVTGRVVDGAERPITAPDVLIEVLQGDQFVRTLTDDAGEFAFTVRKPEPTRLADGRLQAPFFHVILHVFPLPELHRTRLYFADETEANSADPLLSYLDDEDGRTLLAAPDDGGYRWEIRLSGERQTAFLVSLGEPSLLDGGETPSRPFREQLSV